MTMRQDRRLQINEDRLLHDTIDGETIVINLENGHYYSLNGPASRLWERISSPGGASVSELGQALPEAPGATEAAAAVIAWASNLVEEGVVLADEPLSPATGDSTQADWAPRTRRFTDMKDYLLVDPIHDVGDEGWPGTASA